MITLIAAVGKRNELGFKNQLPWKLPADLKHFKNYTYGKVVIMGYNTYLSIGKELPGRRNIIVSRTLPNTMSIVAHSIEEAFSIEKFYDELVVIGGATIYNQSIKYAHKLMITQIDEEFEADTFFPAIDHDIWEIKNVVKGDIQPHKYDFIEYLRKD
jgi:dihydrofolate reductase